MSSTSEDVRPWWTQRPASPTDSATTSTNAATSWSVTSLALADGLGGERGPLAHQRGVLGRHHARSARASTTASSTSSQVSSLRCSDHSDRISGRV